MPSDGLAPCSCPLKAPEARQAIITPREDSIIKIKHLNFPALRARFTMSFSKDQLKRLLAAFLWLGLLPLAGPSPCLYLTPVSSDCSHQDADQGARSLKIALVESFSTDGASATLPEGLPINLWWVDGSCASVLGSSPNSRLRPEATPAYDYDHLYRSVAFSPEGSDCPTKRLEFTLLGLKPSGVS